MTESVTGFDYRRRFRTGKWSTVQHRNKRVGTEPEGNTIQTGWVGFGIRSNCRAELIDRVGLAEFSLPPQLPMLKELNFPSYLTWAVARAGALQCISPAMWLPDVNGLVLFTFGFVPRADSRKAFAIFEAAL